jgi:hypothetical protein
MLAAEVACRQLGLAGGNYSYSFGPGLESQRILMDDIACSGVEAGLGQCNYTADHNCKHSGDVGVVCTAGRPLACPAAIVN